MAARSFSLLAVSRWDALLLLGALLHGMVLVSYFVLFGRAPILITVVIGALYSWCVTWNMNSIAHNFIHNPFFTSNLLNRLFAVYESLIIGFSQTFYRYVHLRHHTGNNDRWSDSREPFDWMSLYRFGRDGAVEGVWSYCFKGFFRGNPLALYRHVRAQSAADARWALLEYVSFSALFVLGFVWSPLAVATFLPFYYLGHVLSSLNGYFEHFGSTPETPLAWGVSSYSRLYNRIWFNNGYHAEHHYRPRVHWREMPALQRAFAADMQQAGTKVLPYSHAVELLRWRRSGGRSEMRRANTKECPLFRA